MTLSHPLYLRRLDYPLIAVFIEFDTVLNIVFNVLPMVVKAPIAATETRAAMSPYSMAVAPDSSPIKHLNCLYMTHLLL